MASLSAITSGYVSPNGVVLSLPHAAGMQSSLPLLQKNYKFTKVFFWGKLSGVTGEYLIAMGIEDSYATKKFFYCQDGVSWAQLPAVTPEMVADCAKIDEPGKGLSGDVSKLSTLPAEPVPEGEEEAEPAEPRTVDELSRLAVMVSAIDTECAMLPAAALTKKADGAVVDSPTFSGLDFSKASAPKSYAFLNKPKDLPVSADAVTQATDFLTTTDSLVPAGALCSKFDEATNVVTWRNLLYPGFFAYALVGAAVHGYCYFGTGEKNADIAFMLP